MLSKSLIQIHNPPFFQCLHRPICTGPATKIQIQSFNLNKTFYLNINSDCRPFSHHNFLLQALTGVLKMPTKDKTQILRIFLLQYNHK